MKFAVVASAALMATASADPCDILKLTAIAGGDKGTQCTAETGYQPTSLAPPTDAAVWAKLCPSTICRSMLADIKAVAPRGCIVPGYNKDLYKEVIDPIEAKCNPSTPTTAPTPTTTKPGTTTPAPTTTKPGTTTAAPGATTAAPSTGSGSGKTEPSTTPEATTASPITGDSSASAISDTVSPKPAATTPTPTTTKSSATKVAAAAGAVVAAIAASFF